MAITKALCLALLALGATAVPHVSVNRVQIQKRTIPPSTSYAYQQAYKFTIAHEGYCDNYCYPGGLKTIGYGHDCKANNNCAGISVPIGQTAAQALFRQDLSSRLAQVCALPNAGKLNANQYAALVSFTFNSGIGNTQKYFGSDMSSSNFGAICSALPTTNTQGGSANLSSRRQAEGALCSTATSDLSMCAPGSGSSSGGGGSSHPKTPTSFPTSSIAHSSMMYSSGVYQSTMGQQYTGAYSGGSSGSFPTAGSGSSPGSGGSSPGSGGSSPGSGGSSPGSGGSSPGSGGSSPGSGGSSGGSSGGGSYGGSS